VIVALPIIAVLWPVSAPAETPPPPSDYNEIQKEVFRKINERFGIYSGNVVEVNGDGTIYDIRTNLINAGLTATDPVERAYQFFERHKDLFQIPDPRKELVVEKIVSKEDGSGVIQFKQVVGGVEVYQGGCNIFFDKSGAGIQLNRFNCEHIMGLLPDAHNINPIPTIDSLEAGRIAQNDPAHGKNHTYVSYFGIWIGNDHWYGIRPFPDKRAHLFWRLVVNGGAHWGSAEYFIDAHTGEILYVGPGSKVCPGR
jgi:hypothetical protein